jgi:3-oxoacyl-[acyl-carrier protein] reductase
MALRGLAGKTALVTGAAGGIGSATVRRLVEEGCNVVAADMAADGLKRLAADLAANNLLTVTGDVAKPEDVQRFVDAAVKQFGALHLLVNNAAIIGNHYPIAEMPIEEFDRVHSINVRGVFLCLRAALRQMIAQGDGGAIVNLSSVGALRANRGSSPYGSAKRAVIGLSGSAALENGKYGIRVNTICPGPVDTPMLRPALNDMPGDLNAPFANQAIPRIGQPAEIAAFIAWLLSAEASYQTGGVYPVDGGFTI